MIIRHRGAAVFLISHLPPLSQKGTVKDKATTIRDSYGTQWYIDLINYKITNYSTSGAVRSYDIRQRGVHGVTCDNIHQVCVITSTRFV